MEASGSLCGMLAARDQIAEGAVAWPPSRRQVVEGGLRKIGTWLQAELKEQLSNGSLALPFYASAVFLLGRPYLGIVQDAQIYMGRALADLDPNGVGRDLMFIYDGQFGFSVFRYIARMAVSLLGLATAAKALAALAAVAWFFAAFAFARQLASSTKAAWVAVIFAALLPSTYGAPYPFGFAELIAIPRPFAETLVFSSLAALAARRDALCVSLLFLAAVLHPIMALAGVGVFLAVRGVEDKRWFVVGGVGIALLAIAAVSGLPVSRRLYTIADPSLRSLYERRSPFLFTSHWPVESFPPLLVQTVTIAIAAHISHGRARRILAAIIAVGLAGIASTAILGDWLSLVLALQVQPWRTSWLMCAAGALAFGVCAVELWPNGSGSRIVLALLAFSWALNTELDIAGPASLLALAFYFCAKKLTLAGAPSLALGAWAFTVLAAVIWHLRLFAFHWHFAMAAPAGYGHPMIILIRGFLVLPLAGLGAYVAICKSRAAPIIKSLSGVALAAAAGLLWDQRPPAQRMLEEEHPPPQIMQLIARRSGESLWIDGRAEAWFLFGRPQWASPLQGIPIIFSGTLAAEWRRRMQILMDLHLADQKSFAPWSEPEAADPPRLSKEGVLKLCALADAPAWIIAPLEEGKDPPEGIAMTLWHLPEPIFKLNKGDGDYLWQKIVAYGLISCSAKGA